MPRHNLRYQRQMILPEIGAAGQERLANARILVIGTGGLGCPALLYLASAGIGHLGIVDGDRVDASNLHRQILFQQDDIGQPKAKTAAARLSAMNPQASFQTYDHFLTAANAESLFKLYDIVIDGTDNFATKFLINDAAVKFGKPVVYGAIQRYEAQVSVFATAHGPCYRCLYPRIPQTEIMNCAQAGIVGTVAGTAGITQAMEAIKIILGHKDLPMLAGRLWIMDMQTMTSRTIKVPRHVACPTCSLPKDQIELPDAMASCAPALQEIDVGAPWPKEAVLIDVREESEWRAGHMNGALHLPLSALRQNVIDKLPSPEACLLLYCQSGQRSREAAAILQKAGYQKLYHLSGGYAVWQPVG